MGYRVFALRKGRYSREGMTWFRSMLCSDYDSNYLQGHTLYIYKGEVRCFVGGSKDGCGAIVTDLAVVEGASGTMTAGLHLGCYRLTRVLKTMYKVELLSSLEGFSEHDPCDTWLFASMEGCNSQATIDISVPIRWKYTLRHLLRSVEADLPKNGTLHNDMLERMVSTSQRSVGSFEIMWSSTDPKVPYMATFNNRVFVAHPITPNEVSEGGELPPVKIKRFVTGGCLSESLISEITAGGTQ